MPPHAQISQGLRSRFAVWTFSKQPAHGGSALHLVFDLRSLRAPPRFYRPAPTAAMDEKGDRKLQRGGHEVNDATRLWFRLVLGNGVANGVNVVFRYVMEEGRAKRQATCDTGETIPLQFQRMLSGGKSADDQTVDAAGGQQVANRCEVIPGSRSRNCRRALREDRRLDPAQGLASAPQRLRARAASIRLRGKSARRQGPVLPCSASNVVRSAAGWSQLCQPSECTASDISVRMKMVLANSRQGRPR